jgi:hypothetical protein
LSEADISKKIFNRSNQISRGKKKRTKLMLDDNEDDDEVEKGKSGEEEEETKEELIKQDQKEEGKNEEVWSDNDEDLNELSRKTKRKRSPKSSSLQASNSSISSQDVNTAGAGHLHLTTANKCRF